MSFITVPVLVSQFESIPTPSGGNTAVGVLSLSENLTGYENSAFGENALRINSTGFRNVAIGANALELNQDGDNNVGVGRSSLRINTSGNDNVAIGTSALISNVASANTAIGHAAANALQSGTFNVAVGYLSGAGNISGSGNTAIGVDSLSAATGSNNTALGYKSGELITTGANHTIVGRYNGNQGGLDIRTLNNYVVLSDGNGNPRLYIDGAGLVTAPGGFAGAGGGITLNNQTGAYTVVASDSGKAINCTSGTFTVSLTAAATLGTGFACFVWNTGTGVITIDPNGAETIDGVSTIVLQQGEGTQIVCNGTNWLTGSKKTMRGYAENISPGSTRATAFGLSSIGIGAGANGGATNAIAIGSSTYAGGTNSIAIGANISPTGNYQTGIGHNSSGSASSLGANSGSMALGGSYSSGTDSFAAAIASNISSYGAKGANSIAIGQSNNSTVSGAATLGGILNTASGSQSVTVGGNTNTASGVSSFATGYLGDTQAVETKAAFGNGFAGVSGSCQLGIVNVKRTTANATPTVLNAWDSATPNANNMVLLQNNSAFAFSGIVVARQQAAGGTQSAAWRVEGLIRREANAGTTALVASTVTVISNVPGWTLALSADTTIGALALTATGAAGTFIRWVGNIQTSECIYA